MFLSVNTVSDTIVVEKRSNAILICSHTIATPDIMWTITTPLSGLYVMQENYSNNNSDYKLYSSGRIEIYNQFLVEKSYIVVQCLADNQYWSINKTFYLWEYDTFTEGVVCINHVCVLCYTILSMKNKVANLQNITNSISFNPQSKI